MPLFVGPGVRSWRARGELGVRWIESPPLSGRCGSPALLDVVESSRLTVVEDDALLTIASNALAPAWEHLVALGLEPTQARLPRTEELGASDDAPIVQRFLCCSMARVLARLPDGVGVLVRGAEYWDFASLEFLDRLIREAPSNLPIAIETSVLCPRSPLIARWASTAHGVPGKRAMQRQAVVAAERILSVCPQGLPIETMRRLGAEPPDTAERFSWPDGQPALGLSAARARRVRAGLSQSERSALHGAIFDAHPTHGWNYLRRAQHAIASGSADRLLQQHTACVAGMTQMGYDFLYLHLAALAKALPPTDAVSAHLGAARLAPRLWGKGGRQRAVFHYHRALAELPVGEEALPVMHELANLYASARQPSALQRARRWYRAAWRVLPSVADEAERTKAEIRLCNGLALVEYHERHGERALALERHALELISGAEVRGEVSTHDQISRWAEPLVRTNTAKLLIKRFDDVGGGIALLKTLLDHPEPRVQLGCLQNLGRACFDSGDYVGAVDYLAVRTERDAQTDLSETEELYDRLVFVLSLAMIGQWQRAERQLPRISYLAKMNDADAVLPLMRSVEAVCAAARDAVSSAFAAAM